MALVAGLLAHPAAGGAGPPAAVKPPSGPHDYDAVRTPGYTYSELATGERELYDLGSDPDELQNRADDPAYATIQSRLAARLALLRSCSGVEGRDAPSSSPFCE